MFCDTADALGLGRRPTVWKLAHDKVGLLKDREAVDRVDGVLLHAAHAAPAVTGRFVTSFSGRTKKAGRACSKHVQLCMGRACSKNTQSFPCSNFLARRTGGRACTEISCVLLRRYRSKTTSLPFGWRCGSSCGARKGAQRRRQRLRDGLAGPALRLWGGGRACQDHIP